MTKKLTLLLTSVILCAAVFAQKAKTPATKKGNLFGLHFNTADFKGPTGIKDPISGKVYSSIREMDKGFSLSYWRGLTTKVDFTTKVNAMYYSSIPGNSGKAQIGLELEPTISARPFKDNTLVAPFITAGAAVGVYNKKIGGYIPVGLGVQFNFSNLTYIFVQAQRKFTLTEKYIGDNLFYSLGVAQQFGR